MFALLIASIFFTISAAFEPKFNNTPTRFVNPSVGKTETKIEDVNNQWMVANGCGGDGFGNVWCPFSTKSPIVLDDEDYTIETEKPSEAENAEDGEKDEIESETTGDDEGENESTTTMSMTTGADNDTDSGTS